MVKPKVHARAIKGQLPIEDHASDEAQRDLDPNWWDDLADAAEDKAEQERQKRDPDDADEAADQAQRDEEEREENYQVTKEWFQALGLPGADSMADTSRKDSCSKAGMKRADKSSHDKAVTPGSTMGPPWNPWKLIVRRPSLKKR